MNLCKHSISQMSSAKQHKYVQTSAMFTSLFDWLSENKSDANAPVLFDALHMFACLCEEYLQ